MDQKLRVYIEISLPDDLEDERGAYMCEDVHRYYKNLEAAFDIVAQKHFEKLTETFPDVKVYVEVDNP